MRRRILKWVVLPCVACLLLLGLRWAYKAGRWTRPLPTDLLLRLQGDHESPITRELWRRFCDGSLSRTEADGMLAQAIHTGQSLQIRSPCPTGTPIRIYFSSSQELPPDSLWSLDGNGLQVSVDGIPVPSQRGVNMGSGILWTLALTGQHGGSVDIAGLAPGVHKISVTITFQLSQGFPPPAGAPSFTALVSQEILVAPRPVSEYVKPVYSSEIDRRVRAAVSVRVTRDSTIGTLDVAICCNHSPVPVAGRAFIRLPGDPSWTEVCDVGVGAEWDYSYGCAPVRPTPLPASCDVRLVPDPAEAFCAGFDTYFAGTLIWEDVPVEEGHLVIGPKMKTIPPTTSSAPAALSAFSG